MEIEFSTAMLAFAGKVSGFPLDGSVDFSACRPQFSQEVYSYMGNYLLKTSEPHGEEKKISTVYNRGEILWMGPMVRIEIESYLLAGHALHTEKGLLYGSDAIDYIHGKGNQSQQDVS
jgi:hypothetical protein